MKQQISPAIATVAVIIVVVVVAFFGYKRVAGPARTGKPTPSTSWSSSGAGPGVTSPGATRQQPRGGAYGMPSGGSSSSGDMGSPPAGR